MKIIDNDGETRYSTIIYLRRNAKGVLQVMGNPFTTDIKLQLSASQNSKVQVNLYDAGGKLLRSQNAALLTGITVLSVNNVSMLPHGTYYVEAIVNNQRFREKVIKK